MRVNLYFTNPESQAAQTFFDPQGKSVAVFRTRLLGLINVGTATRVRECLVDTGAYLTTIPVATQERLGIPITAETPRRRVSTAGGEVTAYEVVLRSIEIGGWEINDISVLVLDLPGQEQLGLLGLNFLRHFRMDLRTDEGLLLLEPK